MTSQEPVEGGLAEPAELEPEQGTLALMLEGPAGTRADWEKAAAGVLRKAGRLREDEPDDAVWAELTGTTLDGVGISPLGTPALTDGVGSNARPTAPGGRDVRVELGGDDAKRLNAEALADLDGGATSLWLHAGPDTDLAALLDGVLLDLAPVVLDPTDAARHRGAAVPRAPRRHRARPRHQSGRAPPTPPPTISSPSPGWRSRTACSASSSTPPPSTTVALPRPRSSAGRWPRQPACCGRSKEPGSPVDQAAGLVEFRYAATD